MELPEHEIILKEHCGKYEKQVLRFKNGSTAVMWIPDHTPEEEKKLNAKLAKACFEFLFPDEDWNGKNLYVIT